MAAQHLACALVALALWQGVAHAHQLACKVVAVANGDTITVLDSGNSQHIVRVMGIDAPELAQPFGNASRESLSSMVVGRDVLVVWHKRNWYGQLVGKVFEDRRDVGLAQIERGMAWHYKSYQRDQRPEDAWEYAGAENRARIALRGLWADHAPVPPWTWRRTKAAH